jgi:hypothetical protein
MMKTKTQTAVEVCLRCHEAFTAEHDPGWHAAHCLAPSATAREEQALRHARLEALAPSHGLDGIGALYAALTRAQAEIGSVPHDSKNPQQGYKYTSSEAVIREARQALASARLAAFCLGWEVHGEPVVTEATSQKGNTIQWVEGVLRVHFRLAHESGAHLDAFPLVPWIAGPGRPSDKAQAGALTYALGYWLRGLLLIDRPDEAPVDTRDDSDYAPSGRSRPPSRPASNRRQPARSNGPSPTASAPPPLTEEQRKKALSLLEFWTANGDLLDAAERDVYENAAILAGLPDAGDDEWRQIYVDLGGLWKAHKAECEARVSPKPKSEPRAKRVDEHTVEYEMGERKPPAQAAPADLGALRQRASAAFVRAFNAAAKNPEKKAAVRALLARRLGAESVSAIRDCTDPALLEQIADELEEVAA